MSTQSVKERVVVVGAGMAGSRFAAELLLNNPDRWHVTLIGEEKEVGYNRIMLSSLLAKEVARDELSLIDVDHFRSHQGEVIAHDAVQYIDANEKHVHLSSGISLPFDKLVIATGSRSSQLNIYGNDASNIIGFRDMEDVSVMESLSQGSQAVVIGGGLLGLEAAVGLVKRGHKVTVLHRSSYLLNRQLDEESAALLLERLQAMGVEFRLSVSPESFNSLSVSANEVDSTDKAHSISLSSGEVIAADLFVVATGITPEINIAKEAGLSVNRAILVNEFLETSHKDIFAIGECTEFSCNTFGLVEPIWGQMKSLLAYFENRFEPFSIEPVPTKLKVSGVHLFSVGKIQSENNEGVIQYIDRSLNHYRKLIVKEGKLVGAILYGNVADGSWYFQLIQNQTNVSGMLDRLIFGESYCIEKVA